MTEIIEILQSSGLPAILSILLLIILSALFSPVLAAIMRNRKKSYYQHKNSKCKVSTTTLLLHPFFEFMQYCYKIRIQNLSFGSPFKNAVFRDLLIIKYEIFYNEMKSFITHVDIANLTKQELKKSLLDLMNKSITSYIYKWRLLGIPKIEFIIEQFQSWHKRNIDYARTNISKICDSEIYDSNYEKIDAVLTVYSSLFEVTVLDVESGLKEINGSLNGLSYTAKKL